MDQPPPVSEPQPSPPAGATMSLPARLLNIFAVPGEVFEQVKNAAPSTANWFAPALILILVSWVGSWLIFSQDSIKQQLNNITDQAIQQQVDKCHMSKEQAEQAREAGAKYGGIMAKASAVVGPVVAAFATPFWGGLILWLVGAKAFKGNFNYMKAVEVAGLANMVGVLEAIVKTLLIIGTGNIYASPSLVLLLKQFDPQNTAHSLLAICNVMTFWLLGVRSVGLARLSGVSTIRAAAWVFGIWVALTAFFVGISLAIKAAFVH